jgi:hypothetical protein
MHSSIYPISSHKLCRRATNSRHVRSQKHPHRPILTMCSARASIAHPDLFRPFTDPRLGHLFFKKDMSENFLIEVAQNECHVVYSGLQRDFPDVFVSLGCGRTKRMPPPSIASNDTRNTKDTKGTNTTKASKLTITRKDSESQSTYTEDSWDAYAQYPRPNFISLNPTLDSLPELDDVACISHLQQVIRESTDPIVITKLVRQLFATLFYAETDDPVQDSGASEILIPGPSPPSPSSFPH